MSHEGSPKLGTYCCADPKSTAALLIAVPEFKTLAHLAHDVPLRDAVIDDSHRRVVTVDAEGGLGLFDLEDGAPIHLTLSGDTPASLGVACASIALDRPTLEPLWSVPAGKRVVDLGFSPDGTALASASWDQPVRVYERLAGTTLAEHAERNSPMEVLWSPTGATLVSFGIWRAVHCVDTVAMATGGWACESLVYGPGILAAVGATPAGSIVTIGSSVGFQVWYRGNGGPCGAPFNWTNALQVTLTP